MEKSFFNEHEIKLNFKTKLTVFHHNRQKSNDDFGRRPNQNLSFSAFLGVADRTQSVG